MVITRAGRLREWSQRELRLYNYSYDHDYDYNCNYHHLSEWEGGGGFANFSNLFFAFRHIFLAIFVLLRNSPSLTGICVYDKRLIGSDFAERCGWYVLRCLLMVYLVDLLLCQ